MIFIIFFTGFIIGLIRGGKVSNIKKLKLTHPWMIFLSVLIEVFLLLLMRNDVEITQLFAFLASIPQYFLLFLFIWFNRQLPYIQVIGLGCFLNALVILLNFGSMPLADIAAYIRESESASQYLLERNLVTYHIINENTKLWFLGDIIWLPSPFYAFISIGDLFLYSGVLLLIQHIITGNVQLKKEQKKKQSA